MPILSASAKALMMLRDVPEPESAISKSSCDATTRNQRAKISSYEKSFARAVSVAPSRVNADTPAPSKSFAMCWALA